MYGENVETVDVYVNRIRQVAAMLRYGKFLKIQSLASYIGYYIQ